MGAKLLVYPPEYLRRRAEQTRAMVGTTTCDATLAMLEKRAAEYDRIAELLERSVDPELRTEERMRLPRKRAARSRAYRG
jgi:hypothetical protein